MPKAGILGSGIVGKTLATGFKRHGYDVMIGTNHPEKLASWKEKDQQGIEVGSFKEVANYGDILVLAAKGDAALKVLESAEADAVRSKTVIDATNPIDSRGPENGVLHFFTSLDKSLMEDLQENYPNLHFVKAFNSVGNAMMVNPDYGDTRPTMFICGNNDNAKKEVASLLELFGWETADMGKVEAARAIEPLCILWCIPGFNNNEWSHAFKLLKK